MRYDIYICRSVLKCVLNLFTVPPLHCLTVKNLVTCISCVKLIGGGAEMSLARPGKKQATATEDFDFHISCL